MTKNAIIIISLVDESSERSNKEIEREIMKVLTTMPSRIPWMKNVEKVTVTEV